MLVSLTVGKVDAGVTVLLTPDKRLIEFPSILLPPNISSGSIVDITVSRNNSAETATEDKFRALQYRIYSAFGANEPAPPILRCLNATQTSVVLEWDPIQLATADLISLALFRNGQKAGNIPKPLQMHSTKISGLAVDTEYTFHLVLRTTAGTFTSEKVRVRTHKMTDLSGVTITTGIMPATMRENLTHAVERIGAKLIDTVRIDTTHFVTTEGRGISWEKAVENNIPVVRPEWVEACERSGRILGVTKFYLDALRPGPILQETPAHQPQPNSQKDLPARPTDNGTKDHKPESPASPPENKVKVESDNSSSGEEEEEQKTISTSAKDQQKVRLEDKDGQKLALRPGDSTNASGETSPSTEEEDNDSTSKPNPSPDGSSFQDVQL